MSAAESTNCQLQLRNTTTSAVKADHLIRAIDAPMAPKAWPGHLWYQRNVEMFLRAPSTSLRPVPLPRQSGSQEFVMGTTTINPIHRTERVAFNPIASFCLDSLWIKSHN
jgi:hypothetical protein